MDHVIDEKNNTNDGEKTLIAEHYKNKTTNQESPCFEDVKFKRDERKQNQNFKYFLETISSILYDQEIEKVEMLKVDFEAKKIEKEQLFENLQDIFGKVLCFKYFYLFAQTISSAKAVQNLMDFLQTKLSKLWYRQKCILLKVYSYAEFFQNINQEISNNIFERINNRAINLRKMYQINRDRLFQLVGSIKTLNLTEFFHLKYLNNFLFFVDSKMILQRAFFVPTIKFQNMLAKIPPIDLLIIAFFFNFGITKFESGVSGVDPSKINPNLLKLFLKQFPDFALKHKYDILSDDEDYIVPDEPAQKTRTYSGTDFLTGRNLQKDKFGPKDKKPINQVNEQMSKKVNVFVQETHVNNLKFDFPALGDEPQLSIQKKTPATFSSSNAGRGWGKEQTVIYVNESTKKKAMAEAFPELKESVEEDVGNSLINRMYKNESGKNSTSDWQKEAFLKYGQNQDVVKSSINDQQTLEMAKVVSSSSQGDPSERNLLSALVKTGKADLNPDIIMKKKKEKKK